MADPFLGEIRMGGWGFAPYGWAQCNGAQMQISQNDALYTLLGTTYGGDGVNTYNLPDMRGRLPVHFGNGFVQGQSAGSETVTLITAQLPQHNHLVAVNGGQGTANSPTGLAPAAGTSPTYNAANNPTAMAPLFGRVGGSQPHENLMPYLCITFVISLAGVFPSQG